MDVGTDNFRFNLDQKNGLVSATQTYRPPRTTELHIDSLDRYLPGMLTSGTYFTNFPSQTVAKLVGPILLSSQTNTGTDCLIQTSRPLVYGYFGRVALTQMMLKFQQPTFRLSYNSSFGFQTATSTAGAGATLRACLIPDGYYTYASAAAAIQTAVRAIAGAAELANFTCTAPTLPGDGFTFNMGAPIGGQQYYMAVIYGTGATAESGQIVSARTGRTLGFNRAIYGYPDANLGGQTTSAPTFYITATGSAPNFLPTDYVDVVSQSLTNYKPAKDTNSTLAAPTAVLGRIWLTEGACNFGNSGLGTQIPNTPADVTSMGSQPITVTKSWENPNWSELSPNQTIDRIDIKLLDMWGQTLNWSSANATEWSATLTLTE
jgi:hypothetical protein